MLMTCVFELMLRFGAPPIEYYSKLKRVCCGEGAFSPPFSKVRLLLNENMYRDIGLFSLPRCQ